ncbi:hypothetical protein ACFQDG_06940 [Natronoarchaeum mannanilyticum]|uniref:DUF7979 domain-containing protein n=1 Tax=Natronoarchaeum mannanilyticum TaxID=926360 RepID=A0AAV3T608_9EURY
MKRSPALLLSLLLGIGLFAYPLASPVPEPSEELELTVEPAPENRNFTADREYRQLSADARAFFDAAAPNGTATRSLGEAPEPWATQANESQRGAATSDVVEKDGQLYLVFPVRWMPGIDPVKLLSRFGSLAAGICLVTYVGYRQFVGE